MKKLFFAATALSFLLAGAAQAADPAPAKAPNAQQTKMADCNKQAADKKLSGDERKKFMSECLKGGAAAAPAPAPAPAAGAKKELPPKEAMGACAKKAKEMGKKGDDYKKYMSDCLKAKGPDNVK